MRAGLKAVAAVSIVGVLGAVFTGASAAIASRQSSILALAAQAEQLEGEGRLDDASPLYQAVRIVQRLEALDPDSPWLHVLEGQAYDGVGSYEKAIGEFERARRQLPADSAHPFAQSVSCSQLPRHGQFRPDSGHHPVG